MHSVEVELHFSSAHNLRGYKGKCESLHGHNWKIVAVAEREKLNNLGMVMDFHDLKSHLRAILDKLDHKYLNSVSYFKKFNPTSENIAKYIYDLLKRKVSGLKSITVWESHNSSATYQE